MTKEEFFIMKDKVFKEYDESHNETLELFNSGEKDIAKYKRKFLTTRSKESENFDGCSAQEIINICNDFIEQENSEVLIETSAKFETEFEESIDYLFYQYYEPTLYNEQTRKSNVREEFGEILRPKKYQGFTKSVDCSLMTLFKDGVLSFEALQKIVYTDCEI